MRELSKANIPFKIGFISYNETNQSTDGYKVVDKVILRKGLRDDKSTKGNVLIAYSNIDTNEHRQFYLPLLLMFNNHIIIP
jgi:hypothetical protein